MKKILGIVCGLLVYGSVVAQNSQLRRDISDKYDGIRGKELIQNFTDEIRKDNVEVIKYTKVNQIEIKGTYKDGRYYQLRRIEGDNLPIYYSTQNAISRQLTGVNELMSGGRLGVNLQGKDMIIGVWDGQAVFDKHIEFQERNISRIVRRDHVPNLTSLSGEKLADAIHGKNHATHVAGTLVAKGLYAPAKGLAPEAKVWSYDWDSDIVEMASAAQEGLLVSNHSYGISAIDGDKPLVPHSYFGYYNKDAYQLDRITYLSPYYQPVISAGNDRKEYGKLNPSKEGNDLLLGNANAKNVVVVAAVGLNEAGQLEVAKFSSFGPTNDFRIKPDIAAPGVKVVSTGYDFPRDGYGESTDLYKVSSGTSMASPSVSAILTLWQQGAIDMFKFPLRSATLRALLSHTAVYLKEMKPNQMVGWGMVNAPNGVEYLQSVKDNTAILKESTLLNDKQYSYKFNLTDKANRLLVTLSWTDVEGVFNKEEMREDNSTKKLINDLDVRVFKNGVEYSPWFLNKDFARLEAFKGDNDADNLERIEINDAEAGEYEVVVSHKGQLKYRRQDFSLLISDDDFKGIEGLTTNAIVDPKDIIVWPNPVRDIVNVEIAKDKIFKISEVEIFDLSNRLVKRVKFSATNRAIIDMTDLTKGVYLFYMEVGGERVRTKVIKK